MDPLTISAVVPAWNAMETLEPCLKALLQEEDPGFHEVILVDDGSTDGTAEKAEALGARVLHMPERSGPAAARNLGAQEAEGNVLLFVDADVVIHPGATAKILETMESPSVVAVFGSYDDQPPAAGFMSRYMNLRHHQVHQKHAGEVDSFWAGCGAVRKASFQEVGGFQSEAFPHPSIEDIHLGTKLSHHGRILLRKDLLGTHLKTWSLGSVLFTDIFRRALPWSRLLAKNPALGNRLNVSRREMVCAVVAWLGVVCLLGGMAGLAPLWALVGVCGLALFLNRELFAVFLRNNGVAFAVLALLFHQLYYLYGSSVYAYAWLEFRWRKVPSP